MRSVLVVALAATGCLRGTEYRCTSSDQCGPSGTCQTRVGFCGFPDPQCGERFGDSAGALANQCVGGTPQLDAGHDSAITHDAPLIDGTQNNCPGGYSAIASYPGHQYKLIAAGSWDSQVAACAGAAPLAYLAIPDEAAEITALDTLVTTGTYWVGISESSGSFTTVKSATQTFLPWAPSQPNTTGNSHCVEVSAMGPALGEMDLDRCSDARVAICECEP